MIRNQQLVFPSVCQEISFESYINTTQQLENQLENHKKQQNGQGIISTQATNNNIEIQNQNKKMEFNQANEHKTSSQSVKCKQHKQSKTLEFIANKISKLRCPNSKYQQTKSIYNKTQRTSSLLTEKTQQRFSDTNPNDLQNFQNLLNNYKQQLYHYHINTQKQMKKMNDQNISLKRNIDQLLNKLQQMKNIQNQQQIKIKKLSIQNYQLRQIDSKSKLNDQRRTGNLICSQLIHTPYFKKNKYQYDDRIDNQQISNFMFRKLQDIRIKNRILNVQASNSNKHIEKLEKILLKKNNEIKNLQTKLILNEKQNIPKQRSRIQKNNHSQTRNYQQHIIFNRIKLTDIINKKIQISEVQRAKISLSLVEFYEQKIKQKDYQAFIAQQLIVFYQKKSKKYVLAHQKNNNLFESNIKQKNMFENLLWNMGYNLRRIFKEQLRIDNQTTSIKKLVLNQIDEILIDLNKRKINHIEKVKKILQIYIQYIQNL